MAASGASGSFITVRCSPLSSSSKSTRSASPPACSSRAASVPSFTTAIRRSSAAELVDELDITTLKRGPAPESLPLNAIGRVRVRLAEPVPLDDYADLRRTGAFLLVDEADGTTLAAGMAELEPRTR